MDEFRNEQIAIFNRNKIKTESQLRKIYEQVNSPKPIVKRSADVESGNNKDFMRIFKAEYPKDNTDITRSVSNAKKM
jgi:hypothetical protein